MMFHVLQSKDCISAILLEDYMIVYAQWPFEGETFNAGLKYRLT